MEFSKIHIQVKCGHLVISENIDLSLISVKIGPVCTNMPIFPRFSHDRSWRKTNGLWKGTLASPGPLFSIQIFAILDAIYHKPSENKKYCFRTGREPRELPSNTGHKFLWCPENPIPGCNALGILRIRRTGRKSPNFAMYWKDCQAFIQMKSSHDNRK